MNDAPAQRYFYSEANDGENSETLDDKITRYEGNTITPILTMLECLDPGQQIDGFLPAQLISHLIIRNDHFRKLGASILESAFEALQNFSSTREYINQTMGIDLTNPPDLFNQRIMEANRKRIPTANDEQLNSLKKSFLSNMT